MRIDSQGRPHVFFDSANPSAAVLDGGTWTTHTLAALGSAPQFVLGPDDDEIVIAASDQQLKALVGDQTVELGSSLPVGTFYYQAATAAAGPTLAAALQLGDELEVAWWPDPAAVAIPGTAALVDACPSIGVDDPDAVCPGPCHDGSVGMVANAFAFARSADGVGWLAWIVTHRNIDVHYEFANFEGTLVCQAIGEGHTADVLHLARVPLDGDAPAEVLALPLPDLAQGVFTGFPVVPSVRSCSRRSAATSPSRCACAPIRTGGSCLTRGSSASTRPSSRSDRPRTSRGRSRAASSASARRAVFRPKSEKELDSPFRNAILGPVPRPKAFDPDEALEQAMRLFWARVSRPPR
ncbi:hypothetical protein [Nannocystis pusilla]|uniref:hypothetical protein n=1 Tax=Nannocystis pusilla TaxID=889268 RepID=UPI003B77D528